MRIEVCDVPEMGKKCTSRDVWCFAYFEHIGLVLDSQVHEERDNLRQKFKVRRAYYRLGHNRPAYGVEPVTEEQVTLPQWVIDRAREQFMEQLKVVKWGAR